MKKKVMAVGSKRAVNTRLTQKKYDELTDMLEASNLTTLSELIRHILDNRKIRLTYYDKSLDLLMPDLAEIRREHREIVMNMSQVMKRFHEEPWPENMLKNGKEIAALCQEANLKVEKFVNLITKIILKWLPE